MGDQFAFGVSWAWDLGFGSEVGIYSVGGGITIGLWNFKNRNKYQLVITFLSKNKYELKKKYRLILVEKCYQLWITLLKFQKENPWIGFSVPLMNPNQTLDNLYT